VTLDMNWPIVILMLKKVTSLPNKTTEIYTASLLNETCSHWTKEGRRLREPQLNRLNKVLVKSANDSKTGENSNL